MAAIGTAEGLEAALKKVLTAGKKFEKGRLSRGRWVCLKAWDGDERLSLVHYLEGWTQDQLDAALKEGRYTRRSCVHVGDLQYFKGHVSALGVARTQCIIKQRHWWALGDRDCAVAPTLSVAQQWSPRSSVLLEGEAPCNYFVTDDAAVLREEQDRSSKAAVAATKGGRSSLRTAPRTHIKQGGHSGKGRRASSSSAAAARAHRVGVLRAEGVHHPDRRSARCADPQRRRLVRARLGGRGRLRGGHWRGEKAAD